MTTGRIPLAEPHLTGNASRYLAECLRTNFVSSVGPFVERFESEFAARLGATHAIACASGTAALHVALRLLDVGPGDDVFVSTFTFVASGNPILYQGATPVLVDSDEATWNLDATLVLDELARRHRLGARMPKVIEAVHVLGQAADLEALAVECDRHGITLLEDAAEALGATYSNGPLAGREVGTVGRLGCFSFNGNKIVTSGGGGMIVTDDPSLARRAKHLTTQARVPGRAYFHDEVGYNYRLTNVAAALGVAQLELLDEFLVAKRRIAARYDAGLLGVPGVAPSPRPRWSNPTHWLYSVLLDTEEARDAALDRLQHAGIEARPLWTPLHRMPAFQGAPRIGTGAVAEVIAQRGLSLPSSVTLTENDQDRVLATLREFLTTTSSR
ncbi:MAG: DegT/DnrJ/EryC1/StrS family aminotransferase [Deltaproteobacteria bacterium]|nr:DegT/DnrJ/EryC1/StrS family aminotransferase [Deltaproteobacteria bacterium]